MKILSLSLLYPGTATGQEGIFVHQRLKALPRGCEVQVWRARPFFPLLRTRQVPKEETVDGIPVQDVPFFYLPGLMKARDGSWMLRALQRLPVNEVDLIDAHFGYPTGWAAVKLAKLRGLPVVVTFRGTEVKHVAHPALRERLRECARLADRIICVSEPLAGLARELGAAAENVRVVCNGVDPDLFHPGEQKPGRVAAGLSEEGPVILSVGGLSPRKGVVRVLEALPGILQRHPEAHYLVVGGAGPEGDESARIRQRIESLSLGDRVHLAGSRPFTELPDLYRAADVFVLCSSHEGWANVLNEALASGLRVVATDVGGNRQALGDGNWGTLVPLGDEPALVDAVSEELDAVAAGRTVEAPPIPTWLEVGEQVTAVFEEVLGGE